jgi:DNA-binding response OmpR family regulator
MAPLDQGTIVIVEDDRNIADLIEMYLRKENFRVVQVDSGERGLEAVREQGARLVVLDIGLAGLMDGFDVCRQLRAHSDLPIVMLTARDDEIDRVLGLELGADDYVSKPFSPRELVARVKAILRRAERPHREVHEVLHTGEVEVDIGRREARLADQVVALTTREFDLLRFLVDNEGLALSRQQLLDGVWGPGWYGDERTVDVHVRQLRKKFGDALPLSTVWGVGYRLG